jgi:hypothetical protein
LDATLYEPPPPRCPGQRGRPRIKGERLPNLSVLADDPDTEWVPITLWGWYGAQQHVVEVVSSTAI